MKKWMLGVTFVLGCAVSGSGQLVDTVAMGRSVDALIAEVDKLSSQRKFKDAILLADSAIELLQKNFGNAHFRYAVGIGRKGHVLYLMGQYEDALPFWLEQKNVQEKNLGKEHLLYANTVNNLASLFHNMGRAAEAEPLFCEALSIRKKLLGIMDPDYIASLKNLMFFYTQTGYTDKAELLWIEVMNDREKSFGKNSLEYADALNNIGSLYSMMGKYEKAESFYLETKLIRRKICDTLDPDYAESLHNLAILYRELGRYSESELLHLEAKEIREKIYGKHDPNYAESLSCLGVLYKSLGQYQKTEALYLESKIIWEKTIGKESEEYMNIVNNLAVLYDDLDQYTKSEPYHIESLAIAEKLYGQTSPNFAVCLHNLARFFRHIGRLKDAEENYLRAKAIRAEVLGKKHPDYASTLNGLAVLYDDMGRLSEEANLLTEAINIQKEVLGKNHPDFFVSLVNLGFLNVDLNREFVADSLLFEISLLMQDQLARGTFYLSVEELNRYNLTFDQVITAIFSYTPTRLDSPGRLPAICFDNALFFKGFLLSAVKNIRQRLLANTAATKPFQLLCSYQHRLADEYAKPIAERDSITVAMIEQQANDLEKELARSVAGFEDAFKPVVWQNVQAQLHADEAAIEFLRFKKTFPKPTDTTLYAALLLRPGWEQPRFIPLFEEKKLAAYSSCLGIGDAECAAKRYSQKNISPLFQLLWKPLDSLLAGVKTIYYAPTGDLHLLDFGALSTGDNKTLSDRYRLVRLGSTRSLAEGTKARQWVAQKDDGAVIAQNLALLFGGVHYDADSTDVANAIDKLDTVDVFKLRGDGPRFDLSDTLLRSMGWDYLLGSQKELEQIRPLLKASKIPVRSFTGVESTEEAFKHIGHNSAPPRILHLATHGFFFPNPSAGNGNANRNARAMEGSAFALSEHPMIRSGLAMAGANYARQHGKPFREGAEDGILTAYEISQMNLRGTELVVLSACQTGLGDLHSNEGVYGLQRAFKIAGARYLVMSLQRVPDGPTQEFMTLLYKKWLVKKLPLPDAFRAAQSAMRKKYPDQPLNWSGWVLVE